MKWLSIFKIEQFNPPRRDWNEDKMETQSETSLREWRRRRRRSPCTWIVDTVAWLVFLACKEYVLISKQSASARIQFVYLCVFKDCLTPSAVYWISLSLPFSVKQIGLFCVCPSGLLVDVSPALSYQTPRPAHCHFPSGWLARNLAKLISVWELVSNTLVLILITDI